MCIHKPLSGPVRRQSGISMLELVMFIMIISVALAGVLAVINTTTKYSADPMVRKQSLAIAESLLEEVELMPFTYCDPDDTKAETAASTGDCTAGMAQTSTSGPTPSGESRGSSSNPFDNVADYSGFSMSGITDITGSAISGLSGYNASVTISSISYGTSGAAISGGAALLITVAVTDPNNQTVTLQGIRTRYAPNTLL